MTVATALVSGDDPLPQLVEEAAKKALDKAGLASVQSVLLFLTPEFASNIQPVLAAVVRKTQCLKIIGGLAAGVFTESDWQQDRPSVAMMVFGNGISFAHPNDNDEPLFCFSGRHPPVKWSSAKKRYGGMFLGSILGGSATHQAVWKQAKIEPSLQIESCITGRHTEFDVSTGLHILCPPQRVDQSRIHDVQRLNGQNALTNLARSLPTGLSGAITEYLPYLVALVSDTEESINPGPEIPNMAPVISANPDFSLTLSARVQPEQYITWAIRRPPTAEMDMRRMIERLVIKMPNPEGALMFSCIGRGPYFYGGEDRDWAAMRERFPDLPLIGVYGTGQIASFGQTPSHNDGELHNSVVVALFG